MRHFAFTSTHRILTLLVACVLLVSCGQSPLGARGPVIIAWHSLSDVEEQTFLDLVDQWNRANPAGITVVPERRDPTALNRDVLNGIPRNALPGLMLVSPIQAATYYQKGILAPLNALIDDPSDAVGWNENDRTDLYPFVLRAGRAANGQIVGIPFGGTMRLMLYNRDWLKPMNIDDAPKTWDQFASACNGATDRTKGTLCFGIDPNSVDFEQWLYAHGGQVTTDDMSVLQVSTPAALAAMNHLNSFVQAGQAYRVTNRVQSRDDFAATRVPFMFDWSDQLSDVAAAVKQRGEFDWGVGLLPSEQDKTATTYLAPLWVITQKPAAPDADRTKAAWLFIRWLEANIQTAHWAASTDELPARVSAMNILSAKKPLDPMQVTLLHDIAPLARAEPMIGSWKCVENVLDNAMRQIFDGNAITDTLQIAQATGQSELNFDCSGN